jgi:hypothetical protein
MNVVAPTLPKTGRTDEAGNASLFRRFGLQDFISARIRVSPDFVFPFSAAARIMPHELSSKAGSRLWERVGIPAVLP